MRRGVIALLLMASASRLIAQEPTANYAVALGAPRFLLGTKADAPVVDPATVIALQRRVTLTANEATLGEALKAITEQTGVRFNLSREVVSTSMRVRVEVTNLSLAATLTELLLNAKVDVAVMSANELALVRRLSEALPAVGSVSGVVTDERTGDPLSQAQITIIGTSVRRTTGEDGRYAIPNVPAGEHTLSAKRLGYGVASRVVIVRDGETVTVDFALQSAPSRLTEVVTTATGDQRRVELGNSIARIDAESIQVSAPIRGINDLLTGRAAGVQVFAAGGQTGINGRIRIRGLNSFSVSNDPLVIIDGARVESAVSAGLIQSGAGGGAMFVGTGRMADLNPEEIASIDIVKGPSAATLYGTDAANGVILVTTRRGHGGRPRYSAYTEQGLLEPDPATNWYENWYAFGHSTATGAVQQCQLLQVAAGTCVQDSISRWNPVTQSASSPFGQGHRGLYGAQVSGGLEAMSYFLSAEREEETGYLQLPAREQQFLRTLRGSPPRAEQVHPNEVEKLNLRGNFALPLGKNADVSLSSGLAINETRLPNLNFFGGWYSGRGVAGTDDAGIAAEWGGQRPANALAQVNRDAATRFTGSLGGNYRPFEWLTTRGVFGVDVTNENQSSLARPEDQVPGRQSGSRLDNALSVSLYSMDVSASSTHGLTPKLSSRSSIGAQYNGRKAHLTNVFGSGLAPGGQTVAGAQTILGSEATTQTVVAGVFGEETFGWRELFFLTGAVRLDGGSSFGRNFKTTTYPKASISWLAIDGSAHQLLSLSQLRFRAALGASGVQPDPIAALATSSLITALAGGVQVNGAAVRTLGNPNLKPERQKESEIGFDAEWFAGRVRLEATVYNKESEDALVNLSFAPELGLATTQQFNIGKVRNRGLEGIVSSALLNSPLVRLNLTLNASLNENKLLTLGYGVPPIGVGGGSVQIPGYPVNSLWDRPIVSYSDANGNGILERNEVVLGDTAVYLGTSLPTRQLATSVTIGVLNDRLRLGGLADYRGGYKRFDSQTAFGCVFSANCRAVNDPTTPLDQQANAVAAIRNVFRSSYLSDASFMRLRELALTYFLSESAASKVGAKTLAITLSGRNLLLFTRYRGQDPEGNFTPNLDNVQEVNSQPQVRYFLLRLTAGL
jgi:TonB-linked SusC/RagA family outer membrane protein